MNKRTIAFCTVLALASLSIFSFIKSSETVLKKVAFVNTEAVDTNAIETTPKKVYSDFFYDMGPRFRPIKKSKVESAKLVTDFLSKEEIAKIEAYSSVEVILIINDVQSNIRHRGITAELTKAQLDVLQSADYSTNFLVRADFSEKTSGLGGLQFNYASPHFTVVPEKQAAYLLGKEALIEYFNFHNKKNTANLDEDKLKPAKLYFTVTKSGEIDHINLDRTSGYPSIDNKMIELLKNTAGKWQPAENIKGEKVDQELVVSFGMVGC